MATKHKANHPVLARGALNGKNLFNATTFDLSFSPIVDMKTGRLVALEALARQQETDDSFNYQDINQLRSSAPKLARIFLDKTLAKIFEALEVFQNQNEYTPIFLSLHLHDINREFIETLQVHALQSNVPLSCLIISICLPEGGAVSPERMRQIQVLKRSGVALSGQHSDVKKIPEASSNLIPLDLIKLNQSVLIADAQTPRQTKLGCALEKWARSGCYVVFDGINDAATWQAVAGLGRHFAQGPLVSAPLLSTEISGWHRKWAPMSSALCGRQHESTSGKGHHQSISTAPH